ncbi:sulfatase-like hydrolase/transferase [Propionibacteriaceae bacterium Y1685]
MTLTVGGLTAIAPPANAAPAAPPAAAPSLQRPNVITIVADDLGYDDVSPTLTPQITELKKQGVSFVDGYSAAPVCSPSRYAIMSGREPAALNADNNHTARSVGSDLTKMASLPSMMKRNGYRTAAFGKWDLSGPVSKVGINDKTPNRPDRLGFDQYWGTMAGMPGTFCGRKAPLIDHLDKKSQGAYELRDGKFHKADSAKHLTSETTQRAERFVAQGKQQPFFLYLSYSAPHNPHQSIDVCQGKKFRPEQAYRQMVREMDHGIGQVLDAIPSDQRKNTIVTFVSDNGPQHSFGQRSLTGGKYTLKEGGVRVPYVVSWPAAGLNTGKEVRTPGSTLDYLPTLAKRMPKKPTGKFPGRDLVELAKGNGNDRELHWRYYTEGPTAKGKGQHASIVAVRKGNLKYLRRVGPYGAVTAETVHDLAKDRREQTPITGHTAEFRDRWHAWADGLPLRQPFTYASSQKYLTTHPVGWSRIAGTWHRSGKATTYTGKADKGAGRALMSNSWYVDSDSRVQVTPTGASRAGLAIRSSGSEAKHSGYGVTLDAKNSMITIARWRDGKGHRTMQLKVPAKAKVAPGRTATLRVVARGATLTVWVNGHRAGTWTDTDPVRAGSPGLRVVAGEAAFDNLVVKPL